jgi:hypothetical protein
MRQTIGLLIQIAVLALMPLIILYQLNFGFRLIVMPICTMTGIVVFWIGTRLRESK